MIDWMPWKIAKKELKVIIRKKSIIFYIIFLPFLITLAFSLYISSQIGSSGSLPSNIALGFESIIYFFVILASVTPNSIAAYSIVGEKVEKSLEPLLATPVTDSEILLGKGIAAFLPPMMAIWGAASLFMGIIDGLTRNLLQYFYFPNWNAGVMLLLLCPLAAAMSIGLAVIVSARVSDVRGANQVGSLVFIPFLGIFVAGVNGTIPFDTVTVLVISGIILVVDIILFILSKATFKREEILTKWK